MPHISVVPPAPQSVPSPQQSQQWQTQSQYQTPMPSNNRLLPIIAIIVVVIIILAVIGGALLLGNNENENRNPEETILAFADAINEQDGVAFYNTLLNSALSTSCPLNIDDPEEIFDDYEGFYGAQGCEISEIEISELTWSEYLDDFVYDEPEEWYLTQEGFEDKLNIEIEEMCRANFVLDYTSYYTENNYNGEGRFVLIKTNSNWYIFFDGFPNEWWDEGSWGDS